MCILLVEDEPVILMLTAEALRDSGFEIQETASGDEALNLIRSSPQPFRGLVTDFHLPGRANGGHVAAPMRLRWPTVPIVVTSGRPDIFDTHWQPGFGYNLLRKPYLLSALVDLLQSLVEKAEHPGLE